MSVTAATPEILTPEEVAELLRVKPSFVEEHCRRRSKTPLPVHRVGKYARFYRHEVLEWFANRLNTPVRAKRVRG